MKKILLAVLFAFGFAATSQADIIFSTSDTDAAAGSSLNLDNIGDNGSLYVWVTAGAGNTISGISLDINRIAGSSVEASAHQVFNPSNRWLGAGTGALNVVEGSDFHLVDDSTSVAIGNPGISGDSPVLHSRIDLTAIANGDSTLQLAYGDKKISLSNGTKIHETISYGSASVSVGTAAVPEPGSLVALSLLGAGLALVRRRRS